MSIVKTTMARNISLLSYQAYCCCQSLDPSLEKGKTLEKVSLVDLTYFLPISSFVDFYANISMREGKKCVRNNKQDTFSCPLSFGSEMRMGERRFGKRRTA